MALWVVRVGKHGEHEHRFLTEGRIYLTWDEVDSDLLKQTTRDQLRELLKKTYPEQSPNQIGAALGQIWSFTHSMEKGDWIAVPSKRKNAIHFGEIKGGYAYDADAECPYYHSREVKWLATDIPRTTFDTDILAQFGTQRTIAKIERDDAETRIRTMAKSGWQSSIGPVKLEGKNKDEFAEVAENLEQFANDQIAKMIQARFTGHGMARLVDAILRAQGYTTYLSPAGPDKGVDILAAPGPLGFGTPRICVQVKSGNTPAERVILDQLVGVMQNVHADQGLLVSWGGFKSSIEREIANQFFRVRLWDQDDLTRELLAYYEKLDDSMRAEIPLKRVWMVAIPDESEQDEGE